MSYTVKVFSVGEDGATLPPNAEQYVILNELDEDGNPQVAVLLEEDERRMVA